MPKCPSCNALLDMDFGMVTCKGCQTVLMIDISGQVQMASQDQPIFEEEESDIFEEESIEDNIPDSTDDDEGAEIPSSVDDLENPEYIDMDEPEDWSEPTEESSDEITGGFDGQEASGEVESFEENALNPEASENEDSYNPDFAHFNNSETEHSEDDIGDLSNDESEDLLEEDLEEEPSQIKESHQETIEVGDEPAETFPMASEADPSPLDVTDFANSEESSLEEGELLYDVFLSRIDSKAQKEDLKFVLKDEKLMLNHGEFLKKIRGGKLVIPDLNPIKAKRIVEQLQYSDLDIKWKQKRVIIETIEPEEDFDQGESIEGEEVDF